MNKLISLSRAPLRAIAGSGTKIMDIPSGAICELLEIETDIIYNGNPTVWYKIRYRGYEGYTYSGFFDRYDNALLDDVIDLSDIQTPEDTDAKQYVLIDGRKKFNMCGEICCAYIAGLKLSTVLQDWERKSPNIVVQIWKGSADRGTSAITLVNLLKDLGLKSQRINEYFKEPVVEKVFFTPRRVEKALLDKKRIIFGVKIGNDGYIGTGNTAHWVVIESITVFGEQAIVQLFNPYMNRMEIYSWDFIMKNTAGIDGVVSEYPLTDWYDDISPEPSQPEDPEMEEPKEANEEPSIEEKVEILWLDYLSRGRE